MRTSTVARVLGSCGLTHRSHSTLAAAVAVAGVFGGAVPSAHAETSWLKAIGGDWFDPSRWSAGVPAAGSAATFGLMSSGQSFEVTASESVVLSTLSIRNQSPIFRFMTPATDDLVVFASASVGGPTSPVLTIRDCRAAFLGPQRIGTSDGPGSVLVDGTGSSTFGQYYTQVGVRVGDASEGSIVVTPNGALEFSSPFGSAVFSVIGAGAGGNGSVTLVGEGSTATILIQAFVSIGVSGGEGTMTVGSGSTLGVFSGAIRVGGDGDGVETGGVGAFELNNGAILGSGALIIGSEGTGTMVSHGGSVLPLTKIGEASGNGSLIVDGSTSFTGLQVGTGHSNADVLFTGAGTACPTGELVVGKGFGSQATVTVKPGSTLSPSSVIVSEAGTGTLAVEGTCLIGTTLRLRSTITGANASGLVTVYGDDAYLTAGSIDLGPGNGARLLVRNGGAVQSLVLTSQTSPTAIVEVGTSGSLTLSSAVISKGALKLDSSGLATIASLTSTGGSVEWTLRPNSVGGPAPLACNSATLNGALSVQFKNGFEPDAGTDIPLVTASVALSEGAPLVDIQPVHGYPPLLVKSDTTLSIHVIDHIDGFDLPSSVILADLPITLPTIVHADGITSDVSRQVTWTFSPPGVVEQIGSATFLGVAPGTAIGTAHFGEASATVEFNVVPFNLSSVQLVSATLSSSGLVAGNADSYDVVLFPMLLGVAQQSIAEDGRLILFGSKSSNLVPGDSGTSADVFLKDTLNQSVTRQSVGVGTASGGELGAITPDGRFVAFVSSAYLTDDPQTIVGKKIYLRDRETGQLELVSKYTGAGVVNGNAIRPLLSEDGRYLAFQSPIQFDPADTTSVEDVYLKDRLTGTYKRVSVGTNGAELTVPSTLTGLASDAGQIAYIRAAFGGAMVPYVYDIDSQETEMVVPGLVQPVPSIAVKDARLSTDGRYVVFLSSGNGVIYDGPLSTLAQVYRRDRLLGVTEPVTVNASGAWSLSPIEGFAISADGRYVAFVTKAPNILPGVAGGDGVARLYRKDMLTGVIEYCALPNDGGPPVPFSASVMPLISMSQDGHRIAFVSESTNIVPGVPPSTFQVYSIDLPLPPFGDLNGDFAVGPTDLAILLGDWAGSRYDLDGDGIVGASDLAILLGSW